jgi:dTDP-4-amino-4,6-dideoxygalactose transaminase
MIPLFKVFMAPTAAKEATKVINSGYIGQGPKVEEFETYLKSRFNHDYILSLSTGTNGLHLALRLLKEKKHTQRSHRDTSYWPGLEPGDEILASPLTCTATNWPIIVNGYKIKWVDIDYPYNVNMDLDDLARKISPTTKAIIIPFWGGYPADLDKLKAIQERAREMYGFKPAIIEDAAHAMGSTYKDKPLGTHGNMTMYSLQAIKHITSIDGGLLLLPHGELYRRGKLLRWYGIDREGNRKDFRCEADIAEVGDKLHMNDVNATIGIENFKHANDIIAKHIDNAKYYNENLKSMNGSGLMRFTEQDDRQSAYWLYTFFVDRRDDFMKHMKEHGIVTSRVHERNDKHSAVKEFQTQLPLLEEAMGMMINIPVGWWVTKEQREFIVETIKKGW